MSNKYFECVELLSPPIKRAAYSDRTAWLLAEMSRTAYIKFEANVDELKNTLSKSHFDLIRTFNCDDTQAMLVKRDIDKMAILSFRGTEPNSLQDIISDIDATFYVDDKGVKIHNGFYTAYKKVEKDIAESVKVLEQYALYISGHSLGGALALIATRALNSDNLAACYTYGSPMVGNEEFNNEIKSPIYRIVNAYDPVPFSPLSVQITNLLLLIQNKKLQSFISKYHGYSHHGIMMYLTPYCDTTSEVELIPNYSDFIRFLGTWKNKKTCIKDHFINEYCLKLKQIALKRVDVK